MKTVSLNFLCSYYHSKASIRELISALFMQIFRKKIYYFTLYDFFIALFWITCSCMVKIYFSYQCTLKYYLNSYDAHLSVVSYFFGEYIHAHSHLIQIKCSSKHQWQYIWYDLNHDKLILVPIKGMKSFGYCK